MAESIVEKLPPAAMSFVNKTANPTVKFQKKQAKVFADIDINQINILLIGPWGSGKTYFLVGLLEHGLKVFCLSTDFGGSGLVTVRNELRKLGKSHLEKNLVELVLESYDEVTQFLEKPEEFFPDFYKFGFDLLFWDGFDNFQQSHISDFVADMVPEGRKKEVSEAREAGLQFEQQDWGQIKQATTRALNRFFKLHNKVDGTIWHKVVCSKSKTIQKKIGDSMQYVEVLQPNIQGAAQTLMGAAFSLILLTNAKTNSKNEKVFEYYTFATGDATCKNRGFNLPDRMEAKPYELWKTITEQLGIVKGSKDATLVEKETV